MERQYLVRGDTRPRLVYTLRDRDGDVIDVSAAVVRFKMRKKGSSDLKANVLCTKLTGLLIDEVEGTVDYVAPYDVPGFGGRIRVDWQTGDLDTAGSFEGEIEVTFNDGSIQTVYDKIPLTVREDL